MLQARAVQTMNYEKGKRIGVRRSLAAGTIRDTLMIIYQLATAPANDAVSDGVGHWA